MSETAAFATRLVACERRGPSLGEDRKAASKQQEGMDRSVDGQVKGVSDFGLAVAEDGESEGEAKGLAA